MIALIVRPEAQADIEGAKGWYDGEQGGLGVEFIRELDATLARVRASHSSFPTSAVVFVAASSIASLTLSTSCCGRPTPLRSLRSSINTSGLRSG